ncbi:MAG TPA: hypothetical protein VHG93_11245 [Longimicrobium sp.]|nr:hypothetical protein [Longimicrobium sp.]
MTDEAAKTQGNAPTQRKPFLERAHLFLLTLTLVIGIPITVIGLQLTRTKNTADVGVERAKLVLQAAKDYGHMDPDEVVAIVKALREAKQHRAAETLAAMAEQNARTRRKLAAVILPRHRDSAVVALAHLEHRLDNQPAIPKNLVVASNGRPVGVPRIEILPILPGSETAILPSGETVSRSGSGRLTEDAYGNLVCAGTGCGSGACCRVVLDEQ